MAFATRNSVIAAQLSATAARLDAILAPLEEDIAAIKIQMIGDDNFYEKADEDQKNRVVEDNLMANKRGTNNQVSKPAPEHVSSLKPVASLPSLTPPPQHQTPPPPSPTTATTLIPTQSPSTFAVAPPPTLTPFPSTTLLEILAQPTPTCLFRPPCQPPCLYVRIAPNTTRRYERQPPWITDTSPTAFRRLEWHPPWVVDTGQEYKLRGKPPESQNSAQSHHLAVEPFEEELNERTTPPSSADLRTSRFSGAEELIQNRGQNPVVLEQIQLVSGPCSGLVKSSSFSGGSGKKLVG